MPVHADAVFLEINFYLALHSDIQERSVQQSNPYCQSLIDDFTVHIGLLF